MTDPQRDEQVSARYRELRGGEPPARLDDAILAASRRAVHAGPGARSVRRWAVPVSLAAAVILSVMVTLHVQEELPGLEAPAPASPARAPAAPSPAAPAETSKAVTQAPAAKVAPAPERRAATPPPAKPEGEARAKNERQDARVQAPPQFTPEPAPAPAPVLARKAPDTAPAAVGELSARSTVGAGVASSSAGPAAAAPAAAAPATSAPAAAPMQMRERAAARDLSDAVAKRTEEARSNDQADAPEKQLERIAALRREGRHAEADKLLAEFRQRYPQYRIPEAILEKVDPRR